MRTLANCELGIGKAGVLLEDRAIDVILVINVLLNSLWLHLFMFYRITEWFINPANSIS